MGQLSIPAAPPPAPTVTWWIAPTSIEAHAIYDTPGFPRTVCRLVRWSVAWHEAVDEDPRCDDCTAGIAHNERVAS